MAATDTATSTATACATGGATASVRPWTETWSRPPEAVAREWARIEALSEDLAAKCAGLDTEQLGPNARGLLGIRAAAAWTSGRTSRTPVTRLQEPVTFHAVRAETRAADAVLRARAAGWDYAVGVLRWLHWLTEVHDEVRYPPI